MLTYLLSLSVLILMVILIRGIFRRTVSPTAIYALWLLVAVRMILPVSLATVEVAFPAFLRSEEPARTEITEQPPQSSETVGDWQPDSRPSVTPPSQTVPTTPVTTPSENPPTVITPTPSVTTPIEPPVTPDEPITTPSEPSVMPEEPTPVQKEPISFNWKEIADLIWLSGGIIAATWVLLTRVTFNLKLYKDRRLYKTFRKTKVYISESAGVPCIAGFVPSIYITPEAANSESEELIILHEYTHLRHGDHIWTLVRAVAMVVFWWNPLVWLAVSLSRRDAELACDHVVCANFSDEARLYYARILIDAIPKRHRYAVGLGSSPMKERILMLTRKRKNRLVCLILALLLAISAVGCSFLSFKDKPADTASGDETTDQNPSNDTPIYEAQYLPIPEMTMTPVDALPMDDAAALYEASPMGWDPTFFVFEDGLTFYMRRYYAMDPDENRYMATVTLPEGYTDGRIVYISRGGGSGEIDFWVEAKKDGEVTYLNYYFSCIGYDSFVTFPQQARIVPDDEVEFMRERFPVDTGNSFKGYTLADYKNENSGGELIYEGYTVEYDIPEPDYSDDGRTFAFHLHLPQIGDGSPAAEEWNNTILEKYQAYFDAYLRRTAYGVNRTVFANVVFDTVFTGDIVTIYTINTTGILNSGAGGRSYGIYHYDTAAKKFLTTDEFIAFYAEGQFADYTVADIVNFMNEGNFCTDEGGRPFTLGEDNIQGVIPSIFGGGKFDVVYNGYVLEGGGYADRVLFSPYPTHSGMSVKNNVWADYTYRMVYSEYTTCHDREMYGRPAGYRLLISERSEEGLYDAGYYVDLLLLEDIAEKPEGYTDEYYVPIADDSYRNMYIAIDHETDMGHLNVMIPFGQPSTAQDYYRGAVQKYFTYDRVFDGYCYDVNKDIAEKVASILDDYRNGIDPNAKLPAPETEYTPYPLDIVRENPTSYEIGEILKTAPMGEDKTVNLAIDIGEGWVMVLPIGVGGFGDSYNAYFKGIYFAHGTPAEIDSQGPFIGYVASKDTPWIDLYTADRVNYVGRIPYEIFHDWVATDRDAEWWTPGFMNEYTCFYYAEFGDFVWAAVHLKDTVLSVGRKNIATSTDGGKTWTFGSTRDYYGGNHVVGIGFASDKIAFMSFDPYNEFDGADGPVISRTLDGGKTWELVDLPVPEALKGKKLISGIPYFDENGLLLYPVWLNPSHGTKEGDPMYIVSGDRGYTLEWDTGTVPNPVYDDISAEYKKATNIMNIFVLSPSQLIGSFNGDVDKPITIDGQDYYESKVFASYDELRNSLLTVFSEEITDELLDTEFIQNVDGKLYGVLADGGDSSPIRTSDEIEIINVSDTKRIVRVTVNISDGYLRGYDYAAGRTIDTVYVDFTYEKIGDNWVFTDFPYIRGVYDSKLREKYAEFQFDFGKLVLPAQYDGKVILKSGEGKNLLTIGYDPHGDGRYADDVVLRIWRIAAGEEVPEKEGFFTVKTLGYDGEYIYLLSYGVTTARSVTYEPGFDDFLAECVSAINIYMPHANGWYYFGEIELQNEARVQTYYQMWYNEEITPEELLSKPAVIYDFAEKIKTFTGIDLTGREYTWEYIPEEDRYPFKFKISTENGTKTVEAVIVSYWDSMDKKYGVEVNSYVVTAENDNLINGFDIRKIADYPEIEAAIRASIGKETGELTREDFLRVEELDIHESGISDITPLKAMSNLTYLSANGNRIVDLSPLSGLTRLARLLLVNNGITDITPLAGLKNLTNLNLDGNAISDFSPLSGLTGLTWLSLEGTGLSDLTPLSGLVNLTDARFCSNEIVDLTPIAGWEKIERLCFSFNPVTDVTVLGELDTLIEVKMVYCPVEDLSPVSHLVVEYAEPIE